MRTVCRVGWVSLFGSLFWLGTAIAQPAKPSGPSPAAAGASQPTADKASTSSPDAAAQARKLYDKGRELAKAGKWEGAHAEFRAAYAWLPHWSIAGVLGDAAFTLGKYPEAIDMLSQFLREAVGPEGKDVTEKERADARQHVTEAKQKCGLLTVAGPDGAEARIDTVAIGKLPLQKELYVLPGSHTVEIAWSGGSTKKTVDVVAGKPASVLADGGGAGAGSGGATGAGGAGAGGAGAGTGAGGGGAGAAGGTATGTVPPGDKVMVEKPSLVPLVVLGVGAGVALGAGIGIFVASEEKGAEAIRARDAYVGLPEAQKTEDAKRVVGDRLRSQDGLIAGAALVWVGAAVLGGGAISYGVYRNGARQEKPGQGSASKAAIRWLPAVSPQGAGVVMRGTF